MWRRLLDRLNHEYWPWQLIYLPVWPFYFYQAIRQGRAVFFSNVNPAIDMGGFFGESKSAIYQLLPTDSYPTTRKVRTFTPKEEVVAMQHKADIAFPLIVKPDVGERGEGVLHINDEAALVIALADQPETLLMQALAVGNAEYGLMFARDPRTGNTELLSICGKRFLTVTGDGTRTMEQLLALTWRGRKQLPRLRASQTDRLSSVPAKEEVVMVEPIGNHCRGTVFHDANHLATDELRAAVHELLSHTQGIYYGRMDVRATTEAALRAGRFEIIELNGVSSEPGHIYDPAYTIFMCWRELLRHVRRLGPISREMQRSGHEPTTLHALVVRCEAHFGWRLGVLRRLAGVFV